LAFPESFLEELRSRLSLVAVVGRRVRLERRGREHMGLCPFHKEKTPSFTVSEDKGFFHCFGCGAHGSVFDFVMRTDGVSFPEAVERLATDAGLALPARTPEAAAEDRVRTSLLEAMDAAARFYERTLKMPESRPALDYLRRRGLDDEIISRYRLGFAIDSRSALKAALVHEGFEVPTLVRAGLLIEPEGGNGTPFDRFRGRVMFPIADQRGRVVAFGGRLLGDGQPKYLNSPETPLFHKGRMLYGVAHAARPAREAGTVIVVEGYMDVLALARAGMANAVAPLGTALTEEQMQALWRLVPEPVVCFDGDAAGGRAAARAAERALGVLRAGVGLRFALLPEGEDPDSLIVAGGAEAMAAVLEGAAPLSEVLWHLETGGRDPTTPEQRAALHRRLKAHTARIPDSNLRAHFEGAFGDRVWSRDRGGRGGRGQKQPLPAPAFTGSPAAIDRGRLRERILLAVIVHHPEAFDQVAEDLGSTSFAAPSLDNLRQGIVMTLQGDPGLDSAGLVSHLKACGYSDVLASIVEPRTFEHAFFARPDASLATAVEGWKEAFALYRQQDLRAELKREQGRLAGDLTASGFEYFRALKQQEHHTVLESESGSANEDADPSAPR